MRLELTSEHLATRQLDENTLRRAITAIAQEGYVIIENAVGPRLSRCPARVDDGTRELLAAMNTCSVDRPAFVEET